ncbi:MAG: sulfatase [Planctomycetota bacterium]
MRPVLLLAMLFLLCALLLTACSEEPSHERTNVLFIIVDDLRPELGCYGSEIAKTPHLDRLADRAMLFERAYCQAALCNPSRASVLTGRRPDSTGVFGLDEHFRDRLPDVVTLPQLFKQNGYHTQALGKVFHGLYGSVEPPRPPGWLDDERSWSVPTWGPRADYYHTDVGREAARAWWVKENRGQLELPDGWRDVAAKGLSTEAPDVDDSALGDGQIADRAIALLAELEDRPFFLAVGFLKPHLPFVAPKRYWEPYSAPGLPDPAAPDGADGAPHFAYDDSNELRLYTDQPRRGDIQGESRLRAGYYACTSYVDAQIGRVLKALEEQGLADSTVVVVWGDHGFHLGDNGTWAKKTNFEIATRSPLIIAVPGRSAGRTRALVELVDLYPTLAELCDLKTPGGLEGSSLTPLLDDPNRAFKRAAFSQQARPVLDDGSTLMGRSLRTDRYRYTEWEHRDRVLARELYDHALDPGESRNIAGEPSLGETVDELSRQLAAGWRGAR